MVLDGLMKLLIMVYDECPPGIWQVELANGFSNRKLNFQIRPFRTTGSSLPPKSANSLTALLESAHLLAFVSTVSLLIFDPVQSQSWLFTSSQRSWDLLAPED